MTETKSDPLTIDRIEVVFEPVSEAVKVTAKVTSQGKETTLGPVTQSGTLAEMADKLDLLGRVVDAYRVSQRDGRERTAVVAVVGQFEKRAMTTFLAPHSGG